MGYIERAIKPQRLNDTQVRASPEPFMAIDWHLATATVAATSKRNRTAEHSLNDVCKIK